MNGRLAGLLFLFAAAVLGLIVFAVLDREPPETRIVLKARSFSSLNGWEADDQAPALAAFVRGCESILSLPPGRDMGGRGGGRVNSDLLKHLSAHFAPEVKAHFAPYYAVPIGEEGLSAFDSVHRKGRMTSDHHELGRITPDVKFAEREPLHRHIRGRPPDLCERDRHGDIAGLLSVP